MDMDDDLLDCTQVLDDDNSNNVKFVSKIYYEIFLISIFKICYRINYK